MRRMRASAAYHFEPRVFALRPAPGVGRVLSALRDRRGLIGLDSRGGKPRRFSLVGFDPLPDDAARTKEESRRTISDLRCMLSRLSTSRTADLPGPFHGGFLGALAYDIGVEDEDQVLPADPLQMPRIVGGLYCDFVFFDHPANAAWLVLGESPGDDRDSVNRRREAFLADLASDENRTPESPTLLSPLERKTSADRHRQRIEKVRRFIARGEIYQANLAHRLTQRVAGHPIDIYLGLREANPAPYMAYLSWHAGTRSPDIDTRPTGALLSSSPELLLESDGVYATTRPVKGTIRSSSHPATDAEARRRLLESAKDRAELTMIVDLERNDLGRIAVPGSVRVGPYPRLETYTNLHHLVADVSCKLAEGRDAIHALGALFPGGSITGAPKLRSMEIIAALEEEGRGFFTGSAGFIDTRGHALLNILIRTMIWKPEPEGNADEAEVTFHVGSGITWGSIAALEEEETRLKGEAIAACLGNGRHPSLRSTRHQEASP